MPQDLQSLIDNLYSDSSGPISQRIVSEYNTETDLGIQKGYNSFNFKAQIFGKLLSQKIDSLLNQYKDSNQAGLSELEKANLKLLLLIIAILHCNLLIYISRFLD